MQKTVKKGNGQGRTKGAVSYMSVSLAELISQLKPETNIPVSRRFCEMLKINGKAIIATTKNIKAMTEPVAVVVHDLNTEASE